MLCKENGAHAAFLLVHFVIHVQFTVLWARPGLVDRRWFAWAP